MSLDATAAIGLFPMTKFWLPLLAVAMFQFGVGTADARDQSAPKAAAVAVEDLPKEARASLASSSKRLGLGTSQARMRVNRTQAETKISLTLPRALRYYPVRESIYRRLNSHSRPIV